MNQNTILEKLGQSQCIAIGTSDLVASLHFYQTIGFELVNPSEANGKVKLLSDRSLLLEVNESEQNSLALVYFDPEARAKAKALEGGGISVASTEHDFYQASFQSPNGLWVRLVEGESPFSASLPQKTLLDYPQEAWATLTDYPNQRCGIFGELALPVADLEKAKAFWASLGFNIQEFSGPYPWAIAHDEMSVVGLHQTEEFKQPGLTYFAKGMGEKIQYLKEQGINRFEIFGGTGGNDSNQVLTTPEQLQFFLFSF